MGSIDSDSTAQDALVALQVKHITSRSVLHNIHEERDLSKSYIELHRNKQ